MATKKEISELNNLNISTTTKDGTIPAPQNKEVSCCSSLKTFLVALCFSYFAKAYSGSYMKSSITQIERRFDISSSTVGMVDCSFEFGNLLVIAFVSYFGAKFHRPRIIAAGCFLMALGSFLTAMPHFFMGPYRYDTTRAQVTPAINSTGPTSSISACLANRTLTEDMKAGCVKETSSYTWVYVLVGNLLRGIGETPIAPLGISYIDDFAGTENTPLYIACLHTISMFGPMAGFMLSSVFAKLYVDIGFVDLDTVAITPQDSRWVGAWWLGFLVAGAINLIAGIPFCFLPKSVRRTKGKPSPEEQPSPEKQPSPEEQPSPEKQPFPEELPSPEEQKLTEQKATVKGFALSLKALAYNRLYVMLLLITLLQTNSFLGFITYKPKYMEQQYGQSISRANFITGASTLPAAAVGMFLGGLLMKRYKLGFLATSKLVFTCFSVAFIMSLSVFIMGCDNGEVAGITVSYNGSKLDTFGDGHLFSSCNANCTCSTQTWDPVCGANNVTYMSACLAGCTSSTGSGRNIVYHNCSCIESTGLQSVNSSVRLGSCPRSDSCDKMFLIYVVTQIFTTFVHAIGGSPSYVIVLWSVSSELKSLAVGVYMLLIRALAGIPAPIYFGALIDRTCLKWGTKLCGGRGACRLYDTHSFRSTFLGLTAGIRAPSFLLFIVFIFMVKKKFSIRKVNEQENVRKLPGTPEDGGKGAQETPEIEKQTFI